MKLNCRIWLIIVFTIICSSTVYSCSCVGSKTPKEAVISAKWVLKARVISKTFLALDTIYEGLVFYQSAYSLEVLSVYKGRGIKDTITIITGMGDGDCGFPFVNNREYIVYAHRAKRHYDEGPKVKPFLTTNICDRTTDKCFEEQKEMAKSLNRRWRKV